MCYFWLEYELGGDRTYLYIHDLEQVGNVLQGSGTHYVPGPMLRTLPKYVISSSLQSFSGDQRRKRCSESLGLCQIYQSPHSSKGSARSWIGLQPRHYLLGITSSATVAITIIMYHG